MNSAAIRRYLPGTLAVLLALGGWEILSRSGVVNRALLPPPSVVLDTLLVVMKSRAFLTPLLHTMTLMFAGYAIACVLGVAFGIAMGRSEAIHNLFEPLAEMIRPIPKPALIPPLFLFFGIGVKTMLIIVVLAAFFPVLINTIQGVRGVDVTLVNTARTFRLSQTALTLKVILPAALPMIMTGMRVSLGLALTLTILAEMLAGESGIGYLILDMQRAFQIRQMYAWVVVLAVIGVALNALFEWVERRALPWRGQ